MSAKIWKILNSPIVIVAIIAIALYLVIQPRVYLPPQSGNGYGYPHSSEDSSPQTTRSGARLGGETYYGYFNDQTYSSIVYPKDVQDGPTWDVASGAPPLGPTEAVNAVLSSLSDLIPELADLEVVNVSLSAMSPGGYYIYVIEFQPQGKRVGVGLRLVALMDGTVIRPEISDEKP